MKKLAQYVFLLILIGASAYFLYQTTLNPCDKPLEYSIGRFDTKFGVNKEDFLSYIRNAELVWEKSARKDIFIYKPGADFKINLVYDERQFVTTQKQKTEFGLQSAEDVLKKLDLEFSNMKINYERQVKLHEEAINVFEANQKSYESRVDYWNKRGGAPKKEYEALEREREALNIETQKLNSQAFLLNTQAKELNSLLEKRNQAALAYNRVAQNYNNKYGHGLEFDQAEYVQDNAGQKINIYQFGGKYDLTLALTHEFGHALGMNHVENSKSIMYYITGGNIKASLTPSAEDLAELKRVCDTK